MFKKGDPKPAKGGRRKGVPNKTTQTLKEVFTTVAEEFAPRCKELLAKVEAKDPAKALELFLRLSEYVAPKLTRSELASADGDRLSVSVQIGPAAEVQASPLDNPTPIPCQINAGSEGSKDTEKPSDPDPLH